MSYGARIWPSTLECGDLVLRPLRQRDKAEWSALRRRNAAWLRPWDASDPERGRASIDFRTLRRWNEEQARLGTHLPLAITLRGGAVIGQITAGPIQYGAVRSAVLGYWIDPDATRTSARPARLPAR